MLIYAANKVTRKSEEVDFFSFPKCDQKKLGFYRKRLLIHSHSEKSISARLCSWENYNEQVQRHFTKHIPYSNYSYPKRPQMFNLDSLELCRIHMDLIYVNKIINGYIDLDFD